ncbi:MAG: hypothetical protein Q4D79_09815 [Propionibacteriaceae bacterium]|nr:hypothetical protein [Propionibacteriaceae bacterium]
MKVTAAGSLPGADFRGALSAMTELLPDVLPLPELPARGVGSGMVGRALGIVSDLGFDLQPAGWRLTSSSGADHRRAQAQWRRDLDDAEELLAGFEGVLKIGLAGPWTLAASVERPTGDRLLADHGARRELAQALAAAWYELASEVARRLPGARVLLQVDEPALLSVAAGAIPTASGFGKHRKVAADELVAALRPLAPDAWLHCCAPGEWLHLADRAGFTTVAIDAGQHRTSQQLDALSAWAQEGRGVVAGVVDTARPQPQGTDELVTVALRLLRPLELSLDAVEKQVLLGTACGLAGWPRSTVTPQLVALRDAAPLVAESLAVRAG